MCIRTILSVLLASRSVYVIIQQVLCVCLLIERICSPWPVSLLSPERVRISSRKSRSLAGVLTVLRRRTAANLKHLATVWFSFFSRGSSCWRKLTVSCKTWHCHRKLPLRQTNTSNHKTPTPVLALVAFPFRRTCTFPAGF